ncbi:hypothetical protein RM844_28135 [Streptomyces sp. DSM 44915]|uniref:WXG100 family type VII secretion target n=1 Tax=Streptomyces chisholmiae TaxID=3075540 RepID=A0ABU2JYS6_9ACTN|nr:hypothetical protein [Streptomyces sp. DSM 44915]MDT0270147.1 hypothetical protein [Streptomyces sp. DSM 44915]
MSGDSDLYIDGEVLSRVRSNLTHITDILDDPSEAIDSVGTASAGVRALSDRLGEFGDEWSYGIGQIGEFARGAADTLTQIEQEFDNLDLSLAQALNEANSGS